MKIPSLQSEHKTLTGFFLISMSMLTFELLISRVMSAVAFYHFAFMAICLALFGITVGAVITHIFKSRLTNNYSKSLYYSTVIFSISIFISLLCISQLRAFFWTVDWILIPIYWNLLIIFFSIAISFISCGVCLSLIFERYSNHANKIYCINLLGASIGCLIFMPLINLFGVVNSFLLITFLCLLAASFFKAVDGKLNKIHILTLIILFSTIIGLNFKNNLLELRWVKGAPNEKFFFKEWNSYSYVRLLYEGKNSVPRGWSFAPNKYNELLNSKIEQIHLDIDGGAGTAMTNFKSRDLNSIKFLGYDVTSLPYHLIKDGNVLVIGVGAGRDLLTGLLFNQKMITGVEINKTIIKIHKTIASKFAGDLAHHPKIKLINNEARSYINASDKKFDIIQISLIDTFAATQAGAYALSENNLYTTEAIKTYWEHLNDRGMISISYWTFPYILKILGSATQALASDGIQKPIDHFIIIYSDQPALTKGVANILIKKTPFTKEEIIQVSNYCDEMGFHLALSSYGSPYDELAHMSNPKLIDDYVKNFKLNIAPATDDKPFFFIIKRLNFFKVLKNFRIFETLDAEQILICLLAIMLCLTILFVILPLVGMKEKIKIKIPVLPFAIYFTSIGLGFMFIEMTQITRLSSFLGHPTYSLALALFTFLFGSGVGSLCLGSEDQRKSIQTYTSVFIGYCLLSGVLTSPFLHYCSKFPIQARMLISVVILFPLAFFMGTFLPQGMRLLSRINAPVALFWGLNGAASVLGSILAMMTQIQYGLNITFFCGIGLYAAAIILLFWLERKCTQ